MADDTRKRTTDGTTSTDAALEDAHREELFGWSVAKRFLTDAAGRRGLIFVVAGVTVLVWPGGSGFVLVVIVAIGLILSGISDLASAARNRSRWVEWAKSVVPVAAGASIFILGETSLRLIALGLGVMFAARGLLDIVGVVRNRSNVTERLWPLIRGTGQIVIGVTVALSPASVISVVVVALAATWIFAGLLNLSHVLALDSRGIPSPDEGATRTTITWLRSRDIGTEARQQVVDKLIFEGPARRTLML